jgi:hypothetical protein
MPTGTISECVRCAQQHCAWFGFQQLRIGAARALGRNAQRAALRQNFSGLAKSGKIRLGAIQPDAAAGLNEPAHEGIIHVFGRHQRGDIRTHRVEEQYGRIQAADVVGSHNERPLAGNILNALIFGFCDQAKREFQQVIQVPAP